MQQRRALHRASLDRGATRGYSFTEMIVVVVLLSVLTMTVFPIAKFTVRRQKEIELRTALRGMRQAIDDYKRFSDAGLLPVELGTEGYPSEFEVMIEGVDLVGAIDQQQKFLRRVPVDPMTGEAEWGMRSVQDDFDASSWGGENVFDVYSLSTARGLNGVPYSEW